MRIAAVLLAVVSASASGQAIIERATAEWSKVKTMRATFEQSIINPLTGSSLTAKGDFQQRKPDKLSITFSDPKGDRIVGDGKSVWMFLQSATPGQVMKLSYKDAGAVNMDLIGQFLDAPRSKYDVVDGGVQSLGGRPVQVVTLTAKANQSLPFIRAKVWIDTTDAMIRQFESTESTGMTRTVRLLTLAPNVDVDSAAFVFTVPKGARIVEPFKQP